MESTAVPTDLPRPGGPALWLIAVLFFGVADLTTTVVGFSMSGITEAGPLTAHSIRQYGLGSIAVLKAAVFGAGYLAWRSVPRPHCTGVPLGLAVLGVSVTGWNLSVLAFAVWL